MNKISSSSQTQEQQIAGLEATRKEVNDFIDLTINRDNSVSSAVSEAKKEFYKQYDYLKPECEKSEWEKFCDTLEDVGEWCKEHWKEICLVLAIVVAVTCLLIPGLEGIGIGILTGMLIGALGGATIGGISGYAQYGVEGILPGIINGAEGGMLIGGLFGGLGGIGAIAGEAFGCSALMANIFSVSGKLSLGMMAFDMTALANDFQNRLFQDTGINLGIIDPNIGGLISDLNHKANSNPIYNAFQYAIAGTAVFSGGYVKAAACFVAGTLVSTINGLATIETIKVGDYVLSTDPDTLKTEYKPVLETYIRKIDRLVHLIISGEEIITTVDHSFYVQGRGFIEAGNLLVGDNLISVNGEDLSVDSCYTEKCEDSVTVYNFKVMDYHTYFVGENKVWVHNANYQKDPNKLLDDGWEDSTPDGMKNNTKSKEFTNPKTGDKMRFDPAEEGASGYAGKDHYHQYNPNSTGKSDYYLDANGNPVPKNSKASHILPEE